MSSSEEDYLSPRSAPSSMSNGENSFYTSAQTHFTDSQEDTDLKFSGRSKLSEDSIDEFMSSCGTYVSYNARYYNGQVITTLSSKNTLFRAEFDLQHCIQELHDARIQIPSDDVSTAIASILGDPKLRTYIFFYSTAFTIFMAMLCLFILWSDFVTSLYKYLPNLSLPLIMLIALVASASVVALLFFLIHWKMKKIDRNTDIHLACINETFINHGLLVGMTDGMIHCCNHIFLHFVYYDAEPCMDWLAEVLQEHDEAGHLAPGYLESSLSYEALTVIRHKHERDSRAGSDEESPLLSSVSSTSGPQMSVQSETELEASGSTIQSIRFTPHGSYQEMAKQFLLTYSSKYIKFLVRGGLGTPQAQRHTDKGLCLCQFIEKLAFHTDV
ncbi:PREDICTED: LOW QUALITY PROTEIN: transmembrane protein 268-like [Branchiostoma belcheri]|uniref:LOW QUALITY PROTEIN: transmembrane protein 268-like n=1 Tax=Branchiostoma belcheri TaxID=7741 RepID=A0A6P5ABN8_BRABE|nr:PREDICTED: LOW QUALITY PROTEIN: transmembrane protein 268-like [Branchiostoma belcheri]